MTRHPLPPASSSEEDAGASDLSDDGSLDSLEDEVKALAAARRGEADGAGSSGEEAEGADGGGGGGGHAPPTDTREPLYDAAAMEDALEDIAWPDGAAWAEGRALSSTWTDEVPDPDNDLARELAFHAQALAAARAATASAAAAGVPWARPADYFAEMVKSDAHMARVRAQLEWEKTQIDAADERRKQRDAKQFSKRVQAERKKEKVAARKAAVAGVAKLRADRKRSGFAGGLDAGAAALDLMDGSVRAALGTRFDPSASRKPSAKRAARDAKYGFGGRANTGRRRNDASSAADTRDYRPARFDDGFKKKGGGGGGRGGGGGGGGFGGGFGNKKKGGGGAAKRPGKARRAAARAGR